MGGKRKSVDQESIIKNKIRRLELKLLRQTRNRSRIIYSSESDSDDDIMVDSEAHNGYNSSHYDHVESPPPRRASTPPRVQDTSEISPRQPSVQREPLRAASPRPGPSSAPDVPENPPQVLSSSPDDQKLDDDILLMLGDAPKPESAVGDGIHKDVASRWQEILLRGLQKDIKEKLAQEYLVPSNCNLLVAPSLNPEAKAALTDSLVKRDHAIMQKQQQLGVALSALAQAIELLLKNGLSAQLLKPVSDACRILCDSHYLETKTRRYFVLSSINSDLKDTLSNTSRDGFLFGENVTDKLKAAQSIQKSGDTLKSTPKPFSNRFNNRFNNRFHKSNFILNKAKSQKNSLNSRPLHRGPQSRHDAEIAGQYRPPPRSSGANSARRRTSPPPRRPYRSYRK